MFFCRTTGFEINEHLGLGVKAFLHIAWLQSQSGDLHYGYGRIVQRKRFRYPERPETLMSAFFKLILPLLFLCRPHYVITGNGMRMSPWIIHSSFAMLHSLPWLFLSMFLHPYGSIAIDVEWHSVFPKIYNCAVLRVNGPLLFNL